MECKVYQVNTKADTIFRPGIEQFQTSKHKYRSLINIQHGELNHTAKNRLWENIQHNTIHKKARSEMDTTKNSNHFRSSKHAHLYSSKMVTLRRMMTKINTNSIISDGHAPYTNTFVDTDIIQNNNITIKGDKCKVRLSEIPDCPATCLCLIKSDMISVTCTTGFWTKVPPIPKNTSSLRIENSIFGKLQADAVDRDQLNYLALTKTYITDMEVDALRNLPNLNHLSLNSNKLTSIKIGTFKKLYSLLSLTLKFNQFKSIPLSEICQLKNLKTLDMSNNILDNITFGECMRHLPHFTQMIMSNNKLIHLKSLDFQYVNHLTDLQLANCHIKCISASLFYHTKKLSTLNLASNYIKHMEEDIFKYTKYMTNLDLYNNTINGTIYFKWFQDMRILKRLNIMATQMTSLPEPEVNHTGLQHLQHLYLSGNRLVKLTNLSFIFINRLILQELLLERCSLKEIEPNTFASMTNLTTLHLDENPLNASILAEGFIGLNGSPLVNLYLTGLHLQDLNQGTFEHLNESPLQYLYMSKSNINSITKGIFSGLKYLVSLDLSFNNIVSIDYCAFDGAEKLRSLFLDSNKLRSFPKKLQSKTNYSIRNLYISANNIQHLTQLNFIFYSQLTSLLISKNQINTIDKGTFKYLPNLNILDMSQNKIRTFPKHVFSPLTKLRKLFLKNNFLQTVPNNSFTNMTELKVLKLDTNPNFRIVLSKQSVLFHNLPSLCRLDLNLCELDYIHQDLFQGLSQLLFLDLSSNFITSWNPDVFKGLDKLVFLNMRKNRITTINKNSFKYLKSLRQLVISNNPFVCDCEMVWYVNWILNGKLSPNFQPNMKKNYECSFPDKYKGISIMDVPLVECESITTVLITGVSLLLFLVLFTTSLYIFKYRWYFRYWLFLLKARNKKQVPLLAGIEYKYDAFISYNSKDRQWVIEKLLPEVEYGGELHVCLHDRDWLAGPAIADNIIDSIEESRRTVLVLSNNFARSQWCDFEMTMAQHKLIDANLNILVLILLEDIHPELMSTRLR